jgi:hypothetical protein
VEYRWRTGRYDSVDSMDAPRGETTRDQQTLERWNVLNFSAAQDIRNMAYIGHAIYVTALPHHQQAEFMFSNYQDTSLASGQPMIRQNSKAILCFGDVIPRRVLSNHHTFLGCLQAHEICLQTIVRVGHWIENEYFLRALLNYICEVLTTSYI